MIFSCLLGSLCFVLNRFYLTSFSCSGGDSLLNFLRPYKMNLGTMFYLLIAYLLPIVLLMAAWLHSVADFSAGILAGEFLLDFDLLLLWNIFNIYFID